MKVDIQAVNFNVDRKLVDFINRKTERLDKFYDKIVGVEVYLKVENTSVFLVKIQKTSKRQLVDM